MTNNTENLINVLTQLANKSPFPDEQNVARLIVSALENNIISESASSELEKGYFRFVFSGESALYDVCFGKNPNKNKYPTCERATRASEFVSRLLGKIGTEYNFYVVPSSIAAPDDKFIKSKLFEGQNGLTVKRGAIVNNKNAVRVNKSRFEVEFVIIAAMGEHYCRINDSIVTNETTAVDGKKHRTYEYTRLEHEELDPDHINNEDTKAALDEAANTVSEFLNDIGGKRGGQIKQKILETLAKAKDSDFYKFLETCSATGEGGVGDISIYPSAIYVGASPARTFRYKISLDRFPKGFDLDIICDAKIKEFTPDMPMYLITTSSKFGGLSFSAEGLDGKGKLEQLEKDDKLVPVYRIENNSPSFHSLTLALPESIKGAEIPNSYKGISDYAVLPDETKSYPRQYYYKSMTRYIDGMRVLSDEVKKCPYSNTDHWVGYLTSAPVCYVGQDGRLGYDKIYRTLTNEADKHICDSCHTVYYADQTRKAAYDEIHRLLDGTGYCERCNSSMNVGAYPCRLENAYKWDAQSAKAGKIFARLDANGDFLTVEKGGNVYSCAKCKKTFYYDGESTGSGASYECELCCSRYCPECRVLNKPTPAKYITNIDKYRCPSCPDVGRKITIGKNAGKCLYRVFDYEKNKEILILDDAENPSLSISCGNCKKRVYIHEGEERYNCEVCENSLCKHCNELKEKSFRKLENTGEYLCRSCPDENTFPIAAGKYLGLGKKIYKAKHTKTADSLWILDNYHNPGVVFCCENCDNLIYSPEGVSRQHCNICGRALCEKCVKTIPEVAKLENKLLLNTGDFFCKACPSVNESRISVGNYQGKKLYPAEKNDGTKGYAADDPIEPQLIFTCGNCQKTIYDTGKKYYCQICGERLCPACMKQKDKDNPLAENLGNYFCNSCYDKNTKIIAKGDHWGKKVYWVRQSVGPKMVYVVDRAENPETIFTCANCNQDVYRSALVEYCDICQKEVCGQCKSSTMKNNEKVVAMIDGDGAYTHLCKSCPPVGTVLEYSDGSGGAMLHKATVVLDDAQERDIKVFDDKDDHQLLVSCKNCGKLLYEEKIGNAHRCSNCEDILCRSCFERGGVNDQERWSVVFGEGPHGAKFCNTCKKSITERAESREGRELLDRIWNVNGHKIQIKQAEREFDDSFPHTVAEEIRLYIPYMNFADRKFLLKKLKSKKNTKDCIRTIEECIQVTVVDRVVDEKHGKMSTKQGVRFKLQVKKGSGIPSTYQFINMNGKIVLENYL